MERARAVSRDAIFRVTFLSASIVAFSATLLSIEQIDLSVNRTLLAVSWSLFAAVVVVGPASVGLEARARYIVEWRGFQPQHHPDDRALTAIERLQLVGILLYSLTLRPRSLFYARLADYSEAEPTQGMWMNARMILMLQTVWDLALALEVIVWVVFSAAVIVLIVAVSP